MVSWLIYLLGLQAYREHRELRLDLRPFVATLIGNIELQVWGYLHLQG
jgi:hypothetical protein